jgi:hypothetical protein
VHQGYINWSCILPKAHERCYGHMFHPSNIRRCKEGFDHGAREASVEAKASEDSLTGLGGGRGIVVAGGRSVRGNWWSGNGSSVAGHRSASRNRSR